MTIYRKIWESHYGPIPDGKEIHHIDGDRSNNNIDNLLLVTIQEHLAIHKSQGDWGAVQAILMRMSVQERGENISEYASKAQQKLISNGNHNFQKIDRKTISKKTIDARIANGSPAFLGIADTVENARNAGLKAKELQAGFLNTESEKHGSKYVKDTVWWTHVTGKRKRSECSPGEDWKRGMKYEC